MFGTAPNRRYVVQWDAIVYSNATPRVDVRVVLKEGRGDIEVCYVNTAGGGTSYDFGIGATSGIQSGAPGPDRSIQYSCNTATLLQRAGAHLHRALSAPT